MMTMNGEDNLQVVEARIREHEREIKRLNEQRDKLLEAGVVSSLKITYSLDRKLYYISDSFNRPQGWLGVAKITERPTSGAGPFMGGYMQITLKDGANYWREYYPFAFWSVKSGERNVPITLDDDMAKDYVGMAISSWKWTGYEAVA